MHEAERKKWNRRKSRPEAQPNGMERSQKKVEREEKSNVDPRRSLTVWSEAE
jgi:hypothetical protein